MLALCQGASPAAQYDELSGYVASGPERARALAVLRLPLDRRWMALLDPLLDDPAVTQVLALDGHPVALARLRADADRDVFDSRTQHACYELGLAADPLATPVLLRWLATPHGRRASPLLLTALGSCGGPDAIPVIEGLAHHEPGRASFYQHAIDAIRARAARA